MEETVNKSIFGQESIKSRFEFVSVSAPNVQPEAGARTQHQVESRKIAEGRVEEENKIRGGSGRPVRGAICVAKDAKSAH